MKGRTLTLLLLAATALAGCIKEGTPEGTELGAGDALPEFSIYMNDGSVLGTADLEGKVSLIMFFHTGCPDCREELPAVQQIYDTYGKDIVLCCISREEGAEEIASYWTSQGLTLPWSAQTDRQVYNLFASLGVPRIYISSGDGKIYSAYSDNPVATYGQLAADIEACLGRLNQEARDPS